MLAVAVARSSYDGNVIRYVFPVLWMTLCSHLTTVGIAVVKYDAYVQFARWRHQSHVTQRCFIQIARQHRGEVFYLRLHLIFREILGRGKQGDIGVEPSPESKNCYRCRRRLLVDIR